MTEITDVARRFGVALSTLRFWERRGLLSSHRRSGRRCYDTDQLYRVALIQHWRDTGLMSIRDIAAILDETPGADNWTATVTARIAAIDTQRARLDTARHYLEHLRGCRHPGPPDSCPDFRALVGSPSGVAS
jgi:DNA-binding transcriptional MerR regulator